MKNKIDYLVSKVSVKTAVAATLFFGLMLYLIDFSPIGVAGLLKVSGGTNILDFETRYTADFAYNLLKSMGEAGRDFYLTKVMVLDIFFPPSLMLFMFCWVSLLLKRVTNSGNKLRYVIILPLIYLLLDYTENIEITAMLINYPARLATICITTGIITSIKKTTVLICLIAFVGLAVARKIIKDYDEI